jgi:ferredoxin like protein
MTSRELTLDDRLGLDKYEIDEENSHILVDQTRCRRCQLRPCLTVCPAIVYVEVEGEIVARYENCLECGTCQVACDTGGEGGITWNPPRGGFGVLFRYG